MKAKSLDAAADKFLASDDPLERKLAVVALAASDQLRQLGKALRESHQADVWEDAVLAMRHWIGRGPGQDQKLYQAMIDAKTFTPAEANAALQLLHDFGDDDLANPATYAYLISRLGNDQLFVRGLAYWHLSRLVPEGKKFGYDPRPQGAARRGHREMEGADPGRQAAARIEGRRQMTNGRTKLLVEHSSMNNIRHFVLALWVAAAGLPAAFGQPVGYPLAPPPSPVTQPPPQTSLSSGLSLPSTSTLSTAPSTYPPAVYNPYGYSYQGRRRRRLERRCGRHQAPRASTSNSNNNPVCFRRKPTRAHRLSPATPSGSGVTRNPLRPPLRR